MFTNLQPIFVSSLSNEMYGLYKLCKEKGYKEYPDSKEHTMPEAYGVYKTLTQEYCDLSIVSVLSTLSLSKMVNLH